MEYANAYDKLYNNMKNKFTVVKNDTEYTLGEYMALKAENALNKRNANNETRITSTLFAYLGEKMNASGTNRSHAFPLKSLASACLCLMVVSALFFSFGKVIANDQTEDMIGIVETTDELNDYDTLNHEIGK